MWLRKIKRQRSSQETDELMQSREESERNDRSRTSGALISSGRWCGTVPALVQEPWETLKAETGVSLVMQKLCSELIQWQGKDV
jgi:hypothetical protein